VIAVFFVVAFALGAVGGVGVYVTTQLTALSADLPAYRSTIRDKLHALRVAASKPSAWDGALKTLQTVQKEIDTTPAGANAAAPAKVEVVAPESRPVQLVLDWLGRVSEPVATAGICLLFVILILLDRRNLRDRLLRLAGGDLHVATDAMDEASERIGRYLRMQFLINTCYAVPMGLGLWWIGVPAAALWGFVAAIMRFVPYIGPIVSAVFPLALAFAVSPDWSMVLWTLALIVALEVFCGNVVEPWLYGSSTGLSAMSIIVAAMFWTALWGPIGLILSTPLTVCLLVLGRHLPSLHFLEVLLGSESSLTPPERLYQRLLADDVEEAADLAGEYIDERRGRGEEENLGAALVAFYDEVGIPTLRIATSHHVDVASAEHRLRLATGMGGLIGELCEQYPAPPADKGAQAVYCIGARWEIDVLAAEMTAHALALQGHSVSTAAHALLSSNPFELPEQARRADVVCLSVFGSQPQARIRLIARRLRRRLPRARIVAAAWNAGTDLLDEEAARRLGVAAVVTSLHELLLHVDHLLQTDEGAAAPPVGADDAARVAALHASGVLDPRFADLYAETIRQAINAFDAKYAEISWIDADRAHKPGSPVPGAANGVPRTLTACSWVVGDDAQVVIADIRRDPRFARNPLLVEHDIRSYAGVPIRDADERPLGALCIMDSEPREMKPSELALLTEMAQRLMQSIRERSARPEPALDSDDAVPAG
jgi:predicted PurR-regulated permease PerM/GAF domain-containing protein